MKYYLTIRNDTRQIINRLIFFLNTQFLSNELSFSKIIILFGLKILSNGDGLHKLNN